MLGSDDTAWISPRVKRGLIFVLGITAGTNIHRQLTQRVQIQKDQWPSIELPELDAEQKATLIKKYLIQFGKKLSTEQAQMIVEKSVTDNPMFLVNFLEEIRVYGSYEGLTGYVSS